MLKNYEEKRARKKADMSKIQIDNLQTLKRNWYLEEENKRQKDVIEQLHTEIKIYKTIKLMDEFTLQQLKQKVEELENEIFTRDLTCYEKL